MLRGLVVFFTFIALRTSLVCLLLLPRDGNGGSEPARAEGLACPGASWILLLLWLQPMWPECCPTGLAWRLRLTQPHVTQESVQ